MLTPRIPYPLRDGGSIAMNQTIEGYLEQGCEVSLLAMNTSRHWVEESTLPAHYQQLQVFKSVYVKTNINPLSAFLNLFTDKSYHVERFVNADFEKELVALLKAEEFDIIQFESIYTSPYLKVCRKWSDAKMFCRVHNIEYLIWQRLSENEGAFLKKKYLMLLTNRLKSYELEILQMFDVLLPISKKEEQYFLTQGLNTCYYLPFGVEEKRVEQAFSVEENSIYHVGSMDWTPNVEGVHWFLDEIWESLSDQLPEVHLYLAGKNMPASIMSKANNRLHVIGEVDDVQSFSLSKHIMIVPLLSGAGIRIKILEAMALGKTVITTSIGAEGIGAIHNEQIFIADQVSDFKECILRCFKDKQLCIKVGRQAKEFVLSRYEKKKIYKDAVEHFNQMK